MVPWRTNVGNGYATGVGLWYGDDSHSFYLSQYC